MTELNELKYQIECQRLHIHLPHRTQNNSSHHSQSTDQETEAHSYSNLVAQTVKNLPAMQETWVLSLGCEDPLEEGMATHSSILAWRIPMERGALQAAVRGVTKRQTRLGK